MVQTMVMAIVMMVVMMVVMMMVMMMFISQSKPNVQQDVAASCRTRMCHSPKRLGVVVMIGTQCGRSAGIEIGSSDGYHGHGDYVVMASGLLAFPVVVGLFVSVCWLAHLIACLLTLFVACYCGCLLSLLLCMAIAVMMMVIAVMMMKVVDDDRGDACDNDDGDWCACISPAGACSWRTRWGCGMRRKRCSPASHVDVAVVAVVACLLPCLSGHTCTSRTTQRMLLLLLRLLLFLLLLLLLLRERE